jgi:predicted dehydrogenase
MTRPIRWGILGTGRIAGTFADDARFTETAAIAAVGSRTLSSAQAFARDHAVPRAYGSYEDLVNDPDVDAVYVATPHPWHLANATLALAANKAVLVEKAFTMTGDEARQLVALARDRRLFVMEAMWTRFLPHVVAIRELVASGALGQLVVVEADLGKWFEPNRAHRLFAPDLGGSAVLDLGVYPISFASMLLGTPRRMVALAEPALTGVDGQVSMIFGYDAGAHAVLTCTSAARTATRACISGVDGRIEIDGDFYAPGGFTLIPRVGDARRFDFETVGRGLHYQMSEVARCVQRGLLESAVMPLDESVAIMDTMEAVMKELQPVPRG